MTESVRDAVFGNVGTTISFRVSADDAPLLVKQFEPTFEASDLIQMANRNFVISMIINGEKVPAFSATTLSIPKSPDDNFTAIVESSRRAFSRPRKEVEDEIRETIEQSEKYKQELSDSGRAAGEQGIATARAFAPRAEDFVFMPVREASSHRTVSSRSITPPQNQQSTPDSSRQATAQPKSNQKPEQKQNKKPRHAKNRPSSPSDNFKKLKISPNTAEHKDNRPSLKDLKKLVSEQETSQKKKDRAEKNLVNHQSWQNSAYNIT